MESREIELTFDDICYMKTNYKVFYIYLKPLYKIGTILILKHELVGCKVEFSNL